MDPNQPNNADCRQISLDMTMDKRPEFVSFELICDDSHKIWDSSQLQIQPYEKVHLDVCVNAKSCCRFVFRDDQSQAKDSKGGGGGHAHLMRLQVEGEEDVLMGKYSDSQDSIDFQNVEKTFGECSAEVFTAQKECTENEHPVTLKITLDETADKTDYFLVCEDANAIINEDTNNQQQPQEYMTIWEAEEGSLVSSKESMYEVSYCVPHSHICAFSIHDRAERGMGGFRLTYGSTLVGSSLPGEPFSSKVYCIGKQCVRGAGAGAGVSIKSQYENMIRSEYQHLGERAKPKSPNCVVFLFAAFLISGLLFSVYTIQKYFTISETLAVRLSDAYNRNMQMQMQDHHHQRHDSRSETDDSESSFSISESTISTKADPNSSFVSLEAPLLPNDYHKVQLV